MNKGLLRLVVLVVLAVAIGYIYQAGYLSQLTLENLKANQEKLASLYANHPGTMIAGFMAVYVLTTALSLPGAAILTLAGGFIFDLLAGTIIVSFASTMGATCAFLVSRFILRDSVQAKFGDKLAAINKGVKKEGAFYLFALRLIPAFPFFVINLLMGLTPMTVMKFFFVSQIGMLPGTIVYVNAGRELGKIDSLAGLASPSLIGSFALLGIIPFVIKVLVQKWRTRQAFAPFKGQKPRSFDYNLLVIGAGSAGLVSSYIAATVKAKVGLIEKHKMGGDCLNTGCVPSKALIQTAKMVHYAKRAKDFGLQSANVTFDFAEVMERVQRVIDKIEPHDSVERYTGLGVECIQGKATLKSPWSVDVGGKVMTARNIILAAGAGPLVPPFKGLNEVTYYTTDNIWELREQPKSLLVLGGGPIGCELAQCFQRLGTQVTQIEQGDRLLPREDADAAKYVIDRFNSEGVEVLTGHTAKEFKRVGDTNVLMATKASGEAVEISFDACLFALGRSANVSGYGLEELGVELTERKTVAVNETLQSSIPNVYVCGDLAGPYQFTHVAAHQAYYCAVNALFPVNQKVDYRVIPWCTFTDPEVARVGLSEDEAKAQNIPHEVTIYGIDDLDRAIADSEDHGMVKVLTVPGKDTILGCTIVGHHAGDLIAEYVAAMKHGFGLKKIMGTVHIYPTMAEANKYVAGEWSKARKPEKLLSYVERYHRWRRG